MPIRVDPVVLHVRGYEPGIDIDKPLCEMTAPYRFDCLVLLNDNGNARIMGLDHAINHADRHELAVKLQRFGVKQVSWRHKLNEHFTELADDVANV